MEKSEEVKKTRWDIAGIILGTLVVVATFSYNLLSVSNGVDKEHTHLNLEKDNSRIFEALAHIQSDLKYLRSRIR